MFNQISIIGDLWITEECKKKLIEFSIKKIIIYKDDLKYEKLIINNSDCILINIKAKITKEILENYPKLKFICVCGTNLNNIDLEETNKRNINVLNVTDYCNESTSEYIFSQILYLAKGFGLYKWKSEPIELKDKTIGIIGFGSVGKSLAKIALGFSMKIIYYSKSRNYDFEELGLKFTDLNFLLSNSDIISINVPENSLTLSNKELNIIKEKTILINTCLGKVFDESIIDFTKKGQNFLIFDSIYYELYKELKNFKNFICFDKIAALTKESREKLSAKVIENLVIFKN